MKFYYSEGGPWIAMRARSMGAAKAAARKLAGGDFAGGDCVLGQEIPFGGIKPVTRLSGGFWVDAGVLRQEVQITVTITCDADVILDHAQLKRALKVDSSLPDLMAVMHVQTLNIREESELYGNV